jgi:uncharacterized protein YrzB (UPF0473 family)
MLQNSVASGTPQMVKVRLDSDEWYPVYTARGAHDEDAYGDVVRTVPVETFDRWTAAEAAFETAQKEIEAIYKQVQA